MSQGAESSSAAQGEKVQSTYARGLVVVGLSVAAGTLAVLQMALLPDRTTFVHQNALALALRTKIIVASLLLGVLAALASGLWARGFARDPEHGAQRAVRLGKLLCPLLVLPMVPAFFVRGPWDQSEILFLGALSLVTLGLERLLLLSFLAWPPAWTRGWRRFLAQFDPKLGSFLALSLVAVAAVYYYFYVGQRTVWVHHKMLSASSDLAEFDNLFFNALHGHPFRSPAIDTDLRDWGALKVHAEFGLYLLLPFYALRPRAETLLWIQAAVIGLSAVPAYLIAARRLGKLAGLVLAVALLFLPVVQRPNFYDYHFSPLGMLMVLWTLYFLDGFLMVLAGGEDATPRARWWAAAFWLSLVLALLSREDVSLGFVALGAVVALGAHRVTLGLTISSLSLLYFVGMKFGVMPRFGRMWFDAIYQDLKAPDAQGFGAVALTLVSNPAFVLRSLVVEPKVLYLLHMSTPLLYLWLRRPWLWAAAAPGFVSTLLVTNRSPMYESSFQYAYLWVPYVFVGSVLCLSSLPGSRPGLLDQPRKVGTKLELVRSARMAADVGAAQRRAAIIALGVAATAACFQLGILLGGDKIRGGFITKTFDLTEQDYRKREQLYELIAKIPPEASVTATEAIGPHVSNRLVMYSLKYALGHEPDYLLVERPRMPAEELHLIEALDSEKYGVIEHSGPFWLLKRGANHRRNRALRRLLKPARRS